MAEAAAPAGAEPTSPEPESPPEKKKARKYSVVLVSVPEFPPQDPGRWLVFRVYPTDGPKAARKAKRMKKLFPEYDWKGEALTHAEILAVKRKPIRVAGLGATVEIQFTARGFKVVVVDKMAPL